MARLSDSLSEAHQRSIGVTIELFEDLLRSLRRFGFGDESLQTLESALAEMASATGAQKPRPAQSELNATLAQMLVYAMELDPRRLRAYGELPEDAANYLAGQSRRLSDLTTELMDSALSGS
jgi:hypothetical protein